MDIIYIKNLKVEAIIGIFDWERQVKQVISVDLEMATSIAQAAQSDDIADALDYKAVTKTLIQYIENSQFQLLETLAQGISDVLLHQFNIPWFRLRISKPGALRGSDDVGLIIERTREINPKPLNRDSTIIKNNKIKGGA